VSPALPEPEQSPYDSLPLDDKEKIGADPAEVAQRRAAMRDNAVQGGAEGDGTPQGKLRSTGGDDQPGGPSADAGASERSTQTPKPEGSESSSGVNQGLKDRADTLANSVKAVAGNKKALIGIASGGGIIGLIIGGFLLYAQLKVVATMEGIEQHFGARNEQAVGTRMSYYLREYLADHLDGAGVRVINNGTASFTIQIMHALWQSGLDSRLQEAGYKIKVTNDKLNPGGKIVEISKNGGTVDKYRTLDPNDNAALQSRVQTEMEPTILIADDSAGKSLWLKHSLYETLGVGSIFDPLNNLSTKINEAKSEFVQGTLEQIYSIPGVGDALNSVITNLLGGSTEGKQLAQQLQNSLSGAADTNVTTILATNSSLSIVFDNTVTKFVTNAAGDPFGLAALGIDLGCHAFIDLTSGQIPQEIQKATELTQVGVFQRYASAADQIKDGQSVTGASVSAISSTLTSTDSSGNVHDMSESNNFQRVNGQAVPYTPSTNCTSYAELCVQKQASQRVTQTAVGNSLQAIGNFSKNPLVAVVVTPSATACKYAADIIDTLNSVVGALVHAALSVFPGANSLVDSITGTVGGFIGGAFQASLGNLLTPVVDQTTAGPDLYNELTAGASNSYNIAAGSPAGTDQTQAAQSSSPNTCWDGETGNNGNPSNDSLCGHALTIGQLSVIDQSIQDQQLNTFQDSSFATKLASLQTPYSLLSRLVNAGPATPQEAAIEAAGSMMAVISPHTWIKLISDIPNWFTPRLMAAGSGSSSYVSIDNGQGYAMDQTGATQYGFTGQELNNPDLDNDGKLHNLDVTSGCEVLESVAVQAGPNTNIDVPSQCQNLLQSGGSSGAAATPTTPGGSLPTGSAAQLAGDILSSSNVTFNGTDVQQDLEDAKNGQPATAGKPLSQTLLALLDELLQTHTFNISALESGGQGHSGPGDPHYEGDAADITAVDGDPIANTGIGRTAHDIAVIQEIAPLMPKSTGSDFYHESGFGQAQCGTTPTLPTGIVTFNDTCSHLHIQVPVGTP
jgi:hypothetical protein